MPLNKTVAIPVAGNPRASSSVTWFHTLIAILINLVWGSMFIAAAIGLREFPPIFFTGIRFMLLIVVLASFIRVPRELRWPLARIGLLMGAGMYLTLYISIALAENTSSIAVFSKLEVPFVLLLGVWLLGERIGIRRIAGISIAMSGALVISFDPAALEDLPAFFWMAVSCSFSALGMIYIRRLGRVHPLSIAAWVALMGGPLLMIISLVFEQDHLEVVAAATPSGWAVLLYTAIMSSVIAHSGMSYLLQRYPVQMVAPFTLLSPIFAVLGGLLLLDDVLTNGLIIGGSLILIGVYWINRRSPMVSEKP
jgi:O-acetylserine/cysteine efflux transporter